jgi:hypothetical protein
MQKGVVVDLLDEEIRHVARFLKLVVLSES